MANTDSPLKQLVESSIADFAAWLLKHDIKSVHPLNVELQGEKVIVDQLYRVTLTDDHAVKLHIEFQGPRSHEPIRLRLLDYMTRHIKADPDLDLHSVVIYVGRGAGATDDGHHQILGLDGKPLLEWRYQVVHLWKMQAEELIAFNRPALLPLVGQTQIGDPAQVLPKVVDNLRSIADETLRRRLFTGLVALLDDQEMVEMIEQLIEEDELLTDTPFMRKWRQKAITEGRAEGRAEGIQMTLRRTILNLALWRFDPLATEYLTLETMLNLISDVEVLETLQKVAVQVQTLAELQKRLQQMTLQKGALAPTDQLIDSNRATPFNEAD